MMLLKEKVNEVPHMGMANDELYNDFSEFALTAHNECMITLLEKGSSQMMNRFRFWVALSFRFKTRGK